MNDRLKVHMTPGGCSQTTVWETDQKVFDYLNRRFGPFVLDVCALPENAKCAKFFTPKDDGLAQDWTAAGGAVWMNPPYGRTIAPWMQKAMETGQAGTRVVCPIPARTDSKWWHEIAMQGQVYLVRGRLKFGGAKASAPFPSAVVVFGPREA